MCIIISEGLCRNALIPDIPLVRSTIYFDITSESARRNNCNSVYKNSIRKLTFAPLVVRSLIDSKELLTVTERSIVTKKERS